MNEFNIFEKAGISHESYTDVIKNALSTMNKKIHWFEVVEQRGRMTPDNKIEFQVVLKIGYS